MRVSKPPNSTPNAPKPPNPNPTPARDPKAPKKPNQKFCLPIKIAIYRKKSGAIKSKKFALTIAITLFINEKKTHNERKKRSD